MLGPRFAMRVVKSLRLRYPAPIAAYCMRTLNFLVLIVALPVVPLVRSTVGRAGEPMSLPEIVQYGTMHEAIGKQQFHERVNLLQLTKEPHFFGVGALEHLAGEISVWDGTIVTTGGSPSEPLAPVPQPTGRVPATMLVGSRVVEWQSHKLQTSVPPNKFDDFVSTAAKQAGMDTARPFVFTIEGEFSEVHMHVIHGACPIHARIHRIELPEAKRPYEGDYDKIAGRLIGDQFSDLFAKAAR